MLLSIALDRGIAKARMIITKVNPAIRGIRGVPERLVKYPSKTSTLTTKIQATRNVITKDGVKFLLPLVAELTPKKNEAKNSDDDCNKSACYISRDVFHLCD